MEYNLIYIFRISPRHSPPTASGPAQPSSLAPAPSSEPLMDLQLETPVVTETTFDPEAARKVRLAKWEAIRARSSVNGTPAPEISSAVQPPPSSAVSDHITSSFSHTPPLCNGSKAGALYLPLGFNFYTDKCQKITSARPCRHRRLQGMILSSLRMTRRNRHSARHKPRILP